MRSAEANVVDLENAIERGIGFENGQPGEVVTADDNLTAPGDVVLIGYSKDRRTSCPAGSAANLAPGFEPLSAGRGWGSSYLADDI